MIQLPLLAAALAVAVFTGGEVTQDDLRADAFLRRAQRQDETLAIATELPAAGSDAMTSVVRNLAATRLQAKVAAERSFTPDEAERKVRDANRILTLRKIFFLEQVAPRIRDARAAYQNELERAHGQNQDMCQVPGEYTFRYIFIGDAHTTATPNWDDLETSAQQVRKLLDAPEADFVALARRFSGSEPADQRGALIGPVTSRGMESTRTAVMENAPLGKVSEPFKSNRGWMMVKMEKRIPRRLMSAEESSETLVMAGKLRRFMPSAVETSVTIKALQRYPYKIDEGSLSSDAGAADKVVVESPLFTLKNGDIYDAAWRGANPEPEAKDLLSGAGKTATRLTVARIAERDFVGRQKVYGDALKMIDEITAAAATRRLAPELANGEALLEKNDFWLK